MSKLTKQQFVEKVLNEFFKKKTGWGNFFEDHTPRYFSKEVRKKPISFTYIDKPNSGIHVFTEELKADYAYIKITNGPKKGTIGRVKYMSVDFSVFEDSGEVIVIVYSNNIRLEYIASEDRRGDHWIQSWDKDIRKIKLMSDIELSTSIGSSKLKWVNNTKPPKRRFKYIHKTIFGELLEVGDKVLVYNNSGWSAWPTPGIITETVNKVPKFQPLGQKTVNCGFHADFVQKISDDKFLKFEKLLFDLKLHGKWNGTWSQLPASEPKKVPV